MNSFVFSFQEVDRTKLEMVGGKGANLGELAKIDGIDVPDGFCISTKAFKRIIGEVPGIGGLLEQLSHLQVEDRDKIREVSGKIRIGIEDAIIPADIENEIARHLAKFGEENAYAVRSSATAEDLPTASFAGQQDTYLNIIGKTAILKHVSKCWASLFSERAIVYRIQNGFDHRKVYLAVVVQKMILPEVAGIMFTADPVTSNRKVLSIDACFGLGEVLVFGLVNADNYKVRKGEVVEKRISEKKVAMYALSDGGTETLQVEPEKQQRQVLTEGQILKIAEIGRKIEKHFNCPQDIEWCLVDDRFYIVQSRPITTLYPIPEVNDHENHVYVSVGHQQMMTDAMRPLGLSIWQMTVQRPMYTAGGRLFVDVAPDLALPAKREILVNVLGKSDPIIRYALKTIIDRDDFIKLLSEEPKTGAGKPTPAGVDFRAQIEYDPTIVPDLIRSAQTSVEELKQNIEAKSGVELMGFIVEDMKRLRQNLSEPRSFAVIMTAMNTAGWLNDKMKEWLGEKSVADTLAQSAPNNVTSEMGLELLDIADVVRPYLGVVEYLQNVKADNFPEGLVKLSGGQESHDAIYAYLNKYGMRCAGEIDITRDRWSEKPITLIPIILSNIKNFEHGASKIKFEQGRQLALKKEQELLDRLRQLPDGEEKVEEAKRKIKILRNFAGYREYPKYHIVNRYFIYKRALLKEAERLMQAGVIRNTEDIYYLTFEELCEVIRTNNFESEVVDKRRGDYKHYQKLTPPRVMTSDGEIVSGRYGRENVPEDAIAGLAVSSGVIEGRARVISKIEDADLEEGDILVTPFTDPSWTPLFVSIRGLVTEVGGLMTHGAVIAREYGLPAVVGVENATRLIKDGQRIRVNGTDGYVEIL